MNESQLILATFFVAFLGGYFAGYGNALYDIVRKRRQQQREKEESQPQEPTFFIEVEKGGCNITWRKEDRNAYLAGMMDTKPRSVTVEKSKEWQRYSS